MEHRDALVSSVTVIVDEKFVPERVCDVVDELRDLGMELGEVDEDRGIIEGVVESSRIKIIEEMEYVEYVRTTITYVADYPPGDPRDRDGCETPDCEPDGQ